MKDTRALLAALRSYGCRLAVRDRQLLVSHQRQVPPELLEAARAKRDALIAVLEAEACKLAPEHAAWLPIADDVLGHRFRMDNSTRESIEIGLRGSPHPLAQRALRELRRCTHLSHTQRPRTRN